MRSWANRGLQIAAAVALLALGAAVRGKPLGPEQVLFESANQERIARGLGSLRWDELLAVAARLHAQAMAGHNTISHQFAGEQDLSQRARTAGARFSFIAENVAEGPDPRTIHRLWMQSPPHRQNLLDPQANAVGISVEMRGGQLFAVEDFARFVPALSFEEQEQLVGARLKAQGLRLLPDKAEARRACRLGDKYQPGAGPMYVMQYSAADLGKLPEPLQYEVQSGHYQTAAVGACSPHDSKGFSDYQVSVLLFK